MATGSDTKATQTEEEEGDYSHLTEKNISFKCPEGIRAKLEKFKVIHQKGFVVGLKIDGKLYHGMFIEAIDSFAPINPIATKRRRPIFYRKNKTRPSGVTRTKKPNVFSRENFPKAFVDTYNTIEARLRYGRDKTIPGFNSLLAPGDSPYQFKEGGVLKSNRKKKSQCVVAGSVSNTDSSLSSAKSNRKKKSQCVVAGSVSNTDSSISSAKSNRKKKSQCVVAGSVSNTDSSLSSAKSNRKKKSQCVVAGSVSNTDSSLSSAKSNRKKKSQSIVAGSTSNTDSPISFVKSNRKKKSQSIVAGSTSNTDSPISCVKSNRKKKSQSVVAGSASNTDSPISFVKSNRKKKSQSIVAGSASNTDSSISSVSKYIKKIKYLKRKENDNVSEKTSNENSSPPCSIFISNKYDGEMSEASSDTSFCFSVSKITSKNENQIKVNLMHSGKAVKGQPRDLNSGPGCMVSTPGTDTDALSMNIDDTLQSVTSSQDSLLRMSEPDLIAFSPEINTEKQCRKGQESVESVSTSSESSEPDLIIFSPEINNEVNFKTKVIERPSVIKHTGLNLLFSTISEVSCRTRETVSPQFCNDELVYKPEKFGDVQFIEDGHNILNTKEKSVNQSTDSKLQNTVGMKDGSINNLILNKITLNKGNTSSEPKLQYKSNVDEIQGTNSNFEIQTLKEVNKHVKRSESHEEIIDVNSNIDSEGKFHLEFESNEKNDTANRKSKQIFACGMPTSYQYISQNSQKDEGIRSRSDKSMSTLMKMDSPQLSESRLPENPEIQCMNDNTDLSRQFLSQICFKRETSSNSKNKENEFDINKNAARISSKYSFHHMPDCKLRNFQRDPKMELGYNSDVLAVANSRSKSQPSFETVKHILEEDANVLSRIQKEVNNCKIPRKTEVKSNSLNEELPIQNSFESKLQQGSIKSEYVAKNIEKGALDNVFHEIKTPFNFRNDEGK